MRLEFDTNGYVCTVVFGCETGFCTEYTGAIPHEPEEYSSYADWADRAKVQAYYLDGNGNLVYDAEKAALVPGEDVIIQCSLEQFEKLGFKAPVQQMIGDSAALAAWPLGSVYFDTNEWSPENWACFNGSTWEQIECGIPGINAWKRIE